MKSAKKRGKAARNKGKRGEREAAELLRGYGFDARRGQQFSGGGNSPDVIHNIPGVHIEVKRTEKINVYNALEQAIEDSDDRMPVVLHRRNGKNWVAIINADDLLTIFKEYVF